MNIKHICYIKESTHIVPVSRTSNSNVGTVITTILTHNGSANLYSGDLISNLKPEDHKKLIDSYINQTNNIAQSYKHGS